MIDDNMTNILKNFAGAGQENPVIVDAKTGETKVINASVEKNAMKILLEGIDTQQRSVNQMPSTHVMAKNTATKHPASNYLVGGEEGEVPEDKDEQLDEVDVEEGWFGDMKNKIGTGIVTKIDTATINQFKKALDQASSTTEVAMMIQTHDNHEKMLDSMQRYLQSNDDPQIEKLYDMSGGLRRDPVQEDAVEEQLSPKTQPKQTMNKKQSFKDIFKSMDENGEDMETRFKRELHDERTSKALKKGENGKSNLAENADDAIYDLRAHIQNLAYFSTSIEMIGEEMDTNNGETFLVLARKIVKAVQEIRDGRV